jgi:hypothetical protein
MEALHKKVDHADIRTGSGPGSPNGQPAWGGGCDRVTTELRAIGDGNLGFFLINVDPVATAPGSDTPSRTGLLPFCAKLDDGEKTGRTQAPPTQYHQH